MANSNVKKFSTAKLEKQRPLDDKIARWSRRKEGYGVDWSKIPASLLRAFHSVCCAEGVSATIGPTRDAGAVVVRLWAGGEEKREYAANNEELCELLELALDALSSDPAALLASMGE